ncbi:MAG TPA: hypothetical protein VGH89_06790 [Pseudonocardia sp.]
MVLGWPVLRPVVVSSRAGAPGRSISHRPGVRPELDFGASEQLQSGIGREGSKEGLLPYLETKTIILDGPPSDHQS